LQTALLRVGTRGSPLALTKAREIVALLRAARLGKGIAEIVPMQPATTASSTSRSPTPGQGLFAGDRKRSSTDASTYHHSAKTWRPRSARLTIAATPPRGFPRRLRRHAATLSGSQTPCSARRAAPEGNLPHDAARP
jgi:porphobilinogen deaminase